MQWCKRSKSLDLAFYCLINKLRPHQCCAAVDHAVCDHCQTGKIVVCDKAIEEIARFFGCIVFMRRSQQLKTAVRQIRVNCQAHR